MKNDNDDFETFANNVRHRWLVTKTEATMENMVDQFDKIDPDNNNEVEEFCADYLYLPPKIKNKSFVESFASEQKKVKKILKLIVNKELKVRDLEYINKRMAHARRKLTATSWDNLSKKNKSSGSLVTLKIQEKNHPVIVTYSCPHHEMIWLAISQVIELQVPVRNCKNCGCFLTLTESGTKKLYCDDTCKNQYTQRKHRHKVKNNKLNSSKM